MNPYRVTWIIDVEAESPKDAALQARAIQMREDSDQVTYHVYSSKDMQVFEMDLLKMTPEKELREIPSRIPGLKPAFVWKITTGGVVRAHGVSHTAGRAKAAMNDWLRKELGHKRPDSVKHR